MIKHELDEKYSISVGNINITVWLENSKIKQSGQFDLPEYLAEFDDTREGRKQAKAYLYGMVNLAKLIKHK